MRAGYYRPMYFHTLKAGLDAQGNIVAWKHVIVGQSILTGTPFEPMMVKDGIDGTSVEGAANLPYAIPNLAVELHSPKIGVPVQWWRSVGSTHTAFATEMLPRRDRARGEARIRSSCAARCSRKHPRHLARARARRAEGRLGQAAARQGRARRGIAVHESFNTVVAQVVEVSVDRQPSLKIDRVVCAVDCGVAVNPNIIAHADGVRHRLRPVGRAARRDHAEGRRRRAVQLPRLPACCA